MLLGCFSMIAQAYSVSVNRFYMGDDGIVKTNSKFTAYGQINYKSSYSVVPVLSSAHFYLEVPYYPVKSVKLDSEKSSWSSGEFNYVSSSNANADNAVFQFHKKFVILGNHTKTVRATGVGESYTTGEYEGYCGTGSGHEEDVDCINTLKVVK